MSNWKKKIKKHNHIISEEVGTYLKGNDFYEDRFSPRFFGNKPYDQIMHHNAPCLKLDINDPRDADRIMKIFITNSEVYVEVEESWGSLDRSYHKKLEEVSIENIDDILDEVTDL